MGMKPTPIVVVLAAGTALGLSACKNRVEPDAGPSTVEPSTEQAPDADSADAPQDELDRQAEPPVIVGNPPPPHRLPTANPPPPPRPTLPTWDEVASPHPEGATNPPAPFLVVTPERDCFKVWVSPFLAGQPDKWGDRVRTDCATEDCGTPISCPEDRVQALLDAETKPSE